LDSSNPDYVYVAIEAGALVQSHDGGDTWIDRVDQAPYDTHTNPREVKRFINNFIISYTIFSRNPTIKPKELLAVQTLKRSVITTISNEGQISTCPFCSQYS
jgi:hypothetical protein